MQPATTSSPGRRIPISALIVVAVLAALGFVLVWPG